MKKRYIPRRNYTGLEERRMQAGKMFAKGIRQIDIAKKLKATPASVCRWYKKWSKSGSKGLKGAGRAGRLPRLGKKEIKKLDKILRKGPRYHGFATELWTLPRITHVLNKEMGVAYHPGHVWKLLGQLNWSLQRPARRAKQRNEEGVLRWMKKDWADIKKKPDSKEGGLSFKMNQE